MARFVLELPMRWGDMDAFAHVNNAAYVTYAEQARIAMFHDNPAFSDALSSGVVVAKHEVEYLRPVAYHAAPLRVDVWVTRLGGASMDVVQEIYDRDDSGGRDGGSGGWVLACRVSSVLVRFDLAAGVPVRLNDAERAALAAYADESAASEKTPGVAG